MEKAENQNTTTPTIPIESKKAPLKDKRLYKINFNLEEEADSRLEERMNQFRHILTTGKSNNEKISKGRKNFASAEQVFRIALGMLKAEDLMTFFLKSLDKDPEKKLEVLTDCYNTENKKELTKYEFVMHVWPSLSSKPDEVKRLLSNRLH